MTAPARALSAPAAVKRAILRAVGVKVKYRRPTMYPVQEAAFFSPARWGFIEACTKAGKTTGASFWLTEKAALDPVPGGVRWWVAPIYAQARIAFDRWKTYNAATRGRLWKSYEADAIIELTTEQTIWFKSGEKPDNLFGEDVRDVVVDEGSRVRNASWHAIRSTLTATRGSMRAIGNVRGRSNWHFEGSRRAQGGAADHSYAMITADDAIAGGVMDREEVESARTMLPTHVFDELYYCIPADDGGNPFGFAAIAACKAPPTGKRSVAYGIDLAKTHDYTVVFGLDEAGKCAELHRWRKPWAETMADIRKIVGPTPYVMDATGVGDSVVEIFQRPAAFGIVGQAIPNGRGFIFTSNSKQAILERLQTALANGTTSIPYVERSLDYPVTEYNAFEYEITRTGVKYSAPAGMHDDVVIAHALALDGFAERKRGSSVGGSLVAF